MKRDEVFIPKKSLGQHFLRNTHVVSQIVESGEISPDNEILEIGPGQGILTEALVASPALKIFLCEKDDQLYELIKKRYASSRVKVIHEDALTLIPSLQVKQPYKVISNLPYNISSPVIISLLTASQALPKCMVLMLQKEVAQRLVTKPGDSNRGWLTVLLEMMSETKIITFVSKNDFYPPPQVESAVIKIDKIKEPKDFTPKQAIRILKTAFGGKRKKIKNSLFSYFKISSPKAVEIAEKCNISLDMRAEDLDSTQWQNLIVELTRII